MVGPGHYETDVESKGHCVYQLYLKDMSLIYQTMPYSKTYVLKEQDESDTEEGSSDYAVTFNICNNHYINGKRWDKYTDVAQGNLLLRKLKKYCEGFGCEVDYGRLVFERCPNTHQIHMHCVMSCPTESYIKELGIYVNDLHRPAKDPRYITFLWDKIYDQQGWKNYLNKDPIII